MSESAAVLFANEAFYLAFANGDCDAMNDVWSNEHPVTCCHPGWAPISGRDDVLASWQAILSEGGAAGIQFLTPSVSMFGSVAYVLCFEIIGAASLAATNIFAQEGKVWRMVHHHAGAAPAPDDAGSTLVHTVTQ